MQQNISLCPTLLFNFQSTMGMNNVMTSFFLFSTLYLLFIHQLDNTSTAAESPNRAESHRRNRPFVPFPPRMPYIKLKNEPFNDLIGKHFSIFLISNFIQNKLQLTMMTFSNFPSGKILTIMAI